MAENTEKKVGFGEKFVNFFKKFFKDYKTEFKKITWPTIHDTNKSFVLVVAATVVVGLVVFGLDLGFNALFNLIG